MVKEKDIPLSLKGIEASIVYHTYQDFEVKSLVVSLGDKRRAISTRDGYKEVSFVVNHYIPRHLWDLIHQHYEEFEKGIPTALGIPPHEVALLTTGVDMDNVALGERCYQEFTVSCLATAGIKSNAQRMGIDKATSVERDGKFKDLPGTINIIISTNATLSNAAIAQAIITVTEAKTATLQDMDIRSIYSPQKQATGTGTDNVIIVSGRGPLVKYTGGHAKMGELIGMATRTAVAKAIEKQNGISLKASPRGSDES